MAVQGHANVTPAWSLGVSWAKGRILQGPTRLGESGSALRGGDGEGDLETGHPENVKRNRAVRGGNWLGDDDFSFNLLGLGNHRTRPSEMRRE